MEPLISTEGRAYPLRLSNVDTDLIIPALHLKTVRRLGLGAYAFESLQGTADNVFEDPAYKGSSILIALDNFGCGSSREHAAWALAGLGIRAIIAPSFSDIFASNAFKNGIATIELRRDEVDRLLSIAAKATFRVDLENLTVESNAGDQFSFCMDPFRRECLISGRDEIGLTLASEAAIRAYEEYSCI